MLNSLVPVSINYPHREKAKTRARCRRKRMSPAFTYAHLKTLMEQKIHAEQRPEQTLHNLNSALTAFCSQLGYADHDLIGSELRASYYKYLASHIETMAKGNKGAPYIANRKSLLKAWKSLVAAEDRVRAAELGNRAPFQEALAGLFNAGRSRRKIAADAGVPLSSIKRWLSGAHPNGSSCRSIRRLEHFFGLRSGELSDLVSNLSTERTQMPHPAPDIEYRKRLSGKQAKQKHSFLKKKFPATQKAAWETVWIPQPALLGDEEDMHEIAAGLAKIQKNAKELA